jgi:hypothetical protein
MKKHKGFGQISLISMIAIPFLVGALGIVAVKSWENWKKDAEEKKLLVNAVNEQRKELNKLAESFGKSQRGIAKVEERSDEIESQVLQLKTMLAELDIPTTARRNPNDTEYIINNIAKKQLQDLRSITQKDWDPKNIDKKEK